MDKKVTLAIISYNSRLKLAQSLESVFNLNYSRSLLKVVIIDNGSTDSSVGFVKEKYPEVKVIENYANRGFAEANNQAHFLAKKNQSEYLFLLNDDAMLERNCLKRLVDYLEAHPKTAAIGPKILLYPDKDKINSLGNSIHFLGFAYCNHYKKKDNQDEGDVFATPYVSGAACLLRLSALKQTGLFDDKLFMYHEDVDLGWKLNLAGYKTMVDPMAVCWHQYNYSKAKYKFFYMDRNRLMVILQNYRVATLIVLFPAWLVMEGGIILFAIKNGWIKEKLKGYLSLIYHLPGIIGRRLDAQFKIRQVSDREILKLYVGSIRFQEIDNPLLRYVVNPLMEIYFYLAKLIIFW